MIYTRFAVLLALTAGAAFGGTILFPGGSLTIPGISTTGTSFVFTGTLTEADTIDFAQTDNPCLQAPLAGPAYCTNGGGVITVAGTTGVGGTTTFSGTFNGTTSTWNFGSLLMEISGVGTVQVFAADAAAGLGNAVNPPTGLTLGTTSLSTLGFAPFSAVNPTITFVVADTFFGDNSGDFLLSQAPEPSSLWLLGSALIGVAFGDRRVLSRR